MTRDSAMRALEQSSIRFKPPLTFPSPLSGKVVSSGQPPSYRSIDERPSPLPYSPPAPPPVRW